jgi:ferredoxin
MGKSCLRFRSLDDLALDVVGEAVARCPVDAFLAAYERSRGGR